MPDELNLGPLLRSADSALTAKIDADAVVRRARRRRRPRLVGAGLASVLAVIVVLGGGGYGLGQLAGSSSRGAASSVDSGGSLAKPQGAGATTGDTPGRCGSAPPALVPNARGLVVTVDFPGSTARSARLTGIATLTNSGDQRVTGIAAVPLVTLAQNGVVVWHTPASTPVVPRQIDLAPGQSASFPVALSPLYCATGDEESGKLRADLPAAPSGQYQVAASLTIAIAGADSDERVSGPSENVTIR